MNDNDIFNMDLDSETMGENQGASGYDAASDEYSTAEAKDYAPQRDSAPTAQVSASHAPQATQDTAPSEQSTQARDNVSKNEASQAALNKREITQEQYEYLEKARARDNLNQVIEEIKGRYPSFDFNKIGKLLNDMPKEEAEKYWNPQGLEILHLKHFELAAKGNDNVVDSGKQASYTLGDLQNKVSNGEASLEEEVAFYSQLGNL